MGKSGGFEFFARRKKGVKPSLTTPAVTQEVIHWTLSRLGEDIFAIAERPDFHYRPPRGSFNQSICASCGEGVLDRYVRMKDGKPRCIPCSGYEG